MAIENKAYGKSAIVIFKYTLLLAVVLLIGGVTDSPALVEGAIAMSILVYGIAGFVFLLSFGWALAGTILVMIVFVFMPWNRESAREVVEALEEIWIG